MPDFITVSIDVTKVDKSRLQPSKREGSTAKYLNVALIPLREPNEYGNEWIVTQSITKDEKESGVKAPIIGYAKRPTNVGGENKKPSKPAPAPSRPSGGPSAKHTNPNDKDEDEDGSLPF